MITVPGSQIEMLRKSGTKLYAERVSSEAAERRNIGLYIDFSSNFSSCTYIRIYLVCIIIELIFTSHAPWVCRAINTVHDTAAASRNFSKSHIWRGQCKPLGHILAHNVVFCSDKNIAYFLER